jgi:hypothetical protein
MKNEQTMASYNLSKRLKELGYPQEDKGDVIAGATAEELQKFIPDNLEFDSFKRRMAKGESDAYFYRYYNSDSKNIIRVESQPDDSFVDTKARLLIWLVENGRVDFNQK